MEIRDLRPDETSFLRDMLYTALAWRPNVELPPREWVLEHPQVVTTAAGSVASRQLILATNAWLAELLAANHDEAPVSETLVSHLLKSNCLVTGQPDWGSVQIHYVGPQIEQEGLLRYLIGFREHNEFHEQCVERIFIDILRQCRPTKLAVYARYTRRGGLDINPWRANFSTGRPHNLRGARQ